MQKINLKKMDMYIVIIFFIVTFVTFIFTPLTGDLRVFAASARQADYVEKNWLYNACNTWELKGIFSRCLMYFLYKMVVPFTGFGNYFFEIGINFVYALLVIAASIGSVCLCGLDVGKKEKITCIILLCIAVFSTQSHCHIQVEMTCAVLLVFAFALYINAMKTHKRAGGKLVVAGMIIGSLFFFKSVLILMSVSFVAAACLWSIQNKLLFQWKYFFELVMGSFVMLIIGGLIILLICPKEIRYMLETPVLQTTLFQVEEIDIMQITISCGYNFLYDCARIPILFMGIVVAVKNMIDSLFSHDIKSIFFRFVLWIVPAVFIIISNQYFTYHYLVFLFPSIIEICLLKDWLKENMISERYRRYVYMVLILLSVAVLHPLKSLLFHERIFHLNQYICFSIILCTILVCLLRVDKLIEICMKLVLILLGIIYFNYISIFSVNFSDYIKFNNKAYMANRDMSYADNMDEILYLDDGKGAYILGVKSYLEYFFPLPLHRIEEGSIHSDRTCYTESFDKVIQYDGLYILINDSWFFGDGENMTIKEKISNEYEKVDNYAVYRPRHEIFERCNDSTITFYDLYRRK